MNKVEQMNNLFDLINTSRELQSLFGVHGVKVKVRRMFLIDGTEITDLDMLGQDEQLFLSEGESFLPVRGHSNSTFVRRGRGGLPKANNLY